MRRIQSELYNLDSDPGERIDVSAAHPDVIRRLRMELQSLLKRPTDVSESVPDAEADAKSTLPHAQM
ncbi:MAG TPA: hypothetical protein VGJ84_01085 [Polyangiaceae bacterium]|jgi:hypothetical protein